jgi:hypothetical protein
MITYCSKCFKDVYIDTKKTYDKPIMCLKCQYKPQREMRDKKLEQILKPSLWNRIQKLFK